MKAPLVKDEWIAEAVFLPPSLISDICFLLLMVRSDLRYRELEGDLGSSVDFGGFLQAMVGSHLGHPNNEML